MGMYVITNYGYRPVIKSRVVEMSVLHVSR